MNTSGPKGWDYKRMQIIIPFSQKQHTTLTQSWSQITPFKFYFIYFWLYWVFVAALGLSLVMASGDCSSLHWAGFSCQWFLLLQNSRCRHLGSIAVAHRLNCSSAWGIFLDQGSNLCPLHWQADSYSLYHERSAHTQFWSGVWFLSRWSLSLSTTFTLWVLVTDRQTQAVLQTLVEPHMAVARSEACVLLPPQPLSIPVTCSPGYGPVEYVDSGCCQVSAHRKEFLPCWSVPQEAHLSLSVCLTDTHAHMLWGRIRKKRHIHFLVGCREKRQMWGLCVYTHVTTFLIHS